MTRIVDIIHDSFTETVDVFGVELVKVITIIFIYVSIRQYLGTFILI